MTLSTWIPSSEEDDEESKDTILDSSPFSARNGDPTKDRERLLLELLEFTEPLVLRPEPLLVDSNGGMPERDGDLAEDTERLAAIPLSSPLGLKTADEETEDRVLDRASWANFISRTLALTASL